MTKNFVEEKTGVEVEKGSFVDQLTHIINCNSIDRDLNLPDFLIADYLNKCISNLEFVLMVKKEYEDKPTK